MNPFAEDAWAETPLDAAVFEGHQQERSYERSRFHEACSALPRRRRIALGVVNSLLVVAQFLVPLLVTRWPFFPISVANVCTFGLERRVIMRDA
jgi:hypothetical protein